MKKHVLTMLLAGTVAAALLVGCGNKTTGDVTLTPTMEPVAGATEAPKETNVPEETKVPEVPTATEVPETPGVTEAPVVTETPNLPEVPELIVTVVPTETPAATETPVVTEVPKATETPKVTEAPKATETPAATETPVPTENPIVTNNNSENNITLGQYKGLTLYKVDVAVIEQEIEDMMAEYVELAKVNRPAEEGDVVNINYVGKKDGVAFAGGTDDSEEGYNLELGSHSFIDGFEEGLIGAVAGEVRDLNLIFPENYHSEELAGQAVVFTVTVNAVQQKVIPEFTDDFAKENLGFDTAAEYKTVLHNTRNEEAFYEQIIAALLETSTVKNYSAELIEQEKQSLIDYYTYYAEMYSAYFGMDIATTLSNVFGFESQEALENFAEEYAYEAVKEQLVLSEVAEKEGLTVSEEEYQKRALVYATDYGYTDVASFEMDYDAEAILDVITTDYIIDYIISQSIIK